MPNISPDKLLQQLRDSVKLLAAPAQVQVAWLEKENFPVDEMAQQFLESVPSWFPFLAPHGLLSPSSEQALLSLRDVLDVTLIPEKAALWTDEALATEPAWDQIRVLAAVAMNTLACQGTSDE